MFNEFVEHQVDLRHFVLLGSGRDLVLCFLSRPLQRHLGPINLALAHLGTVSQAAILQVHHGALHDIQVLEDARIVFWLKPFLFINKTQRINMLSLLQ